MPSTWTDLRNGFRKQVYTSHALQQFKGIQEAWPSLAGFNDAEHLLDFLHTGKGDLDRKDRILADLVRILQGDETSAPLMKAILWLAMWPGLDRLYNQRRGDFEQPDLLVSDLFVAFEEQLNRADLSRINRVAATFILNVRRDLIDTQKRRWAVDNREMSELDDDLVLEADCDPEELSPILNLPPGLTRDEREAAIHAWLVEVLGDEIDADLVMRVDIGNDSQRDAAQHFNRPYEFCRKRLQRARKTLQTDPYVVTAKRGLVPKRC